MHTTNQTTPAPQTVESSIILEALVETDEDPGGQILPVVTRAPADPERPQILASRRKRATRRANRR